MSKITGRTQKTSTDARVQSEQPDGRNLFLDEQMLIELAMRELKGRRPPSSNHSSMPHPSNRGVQTKLERELEGRGWSTRDLALKIGIPAAEAQALARGGQRMNKEIAQKLGQVFATSADYWLRDGD
jgi:ribosome-binding protein aMBF1 (putative translation factor)